MTDAPRPTTRLARLALMCLCGLWPTCPAAAQEGPELTLPQPKEEAPEEQSEESESTRPRPAGPALSLNDAVRIAIARSPKVRADLESFNAAMLSVEASQDPPRLARLLAPDLEVRKLQTVQGLRAAEAQLMQGKADLVYEVTWSYYTLAYARAQFERAGAAVERLTRDRDRVRDIVESGDRAGRDLNLSTVDQLTVFLKFVESQRERAAGGVARADAALRQAMSVEPGPEFVLPEEAFTFVEYEVDEEQAVALALERRGELVQSSVVTETWRLEVAAQAQIGALSPLARTFASGADVHSRSVPQADRGAEYRPGAVGVEAPANLFGSTGQRVAKAKALTRRAEAAYQSYVGLITLEARNGVARMREARQTYKTLTEADEATGRLRRAGRGPLKRGVQELVERVRAVLSTGIVIAQAESAKDRALYEYLLAMADLERITACGLLPPLPGR